jgi:predicted metal-binding protein
MSEPVRVGIIICDRYHTCAGGKCLRALRAREGAFALYKDRDVELVGYTTCGGCPGGNIEYAPEEMQKNGAEVIHLATGLLVGYPPCPHIEAFRRFIGKKSLARAYRALFGAVLMPRRAYRGHQPARPVSRGTAPTNPHIDFGPTNTRLNTTSPAMTRTARSTPPTFVGNIIAIGFSLNAGGGPTPSIQ